MLGKPLVENFVGDKKRSIKREKIKMSVRFLFIAELLSSLKAVSLLAPVIA